MTFQRLAILLLFSAVSAFADTEVSTPRLVRRAAGQLEPAVASSGTDFLVVWTDHQLGQQQILGTRVGADGTALDANPLRIEPVRRWPGAPAVIWSGSTWLVAWDSGYGAFVTPVQRDGTVGAAHELFSVEASHPVIAASPFGIIAAGKSLHGIRVATLNADGVTRSENQIFTLPIDGPFVVPLGRDFLVVWSSTQPLIGVPAIYGVVVSTRGDIVSLKELFTGDVVATPLSVASLGDRALVVYRAPPNPDSSNPWGLAPQLLGRIVTSSGLSDQLVLATGDNTAIVDAAATTYRGNFVVSWAQKAGDVDFVSSSTLPSRLVPSFDLIAAEVSPSGTVLGTRKVIETPATSDERPVLSSNDQDLLLCWIEASLPRGPQWIAAATVDGALSARKIDIARGATFQTTPTIAVDGDVALIAWKEDPESDGVDTIFARRVDTSGKLMDVAPLRVSEGRFNSSPKVASNGHEYVVAWVDARSRAVLRRISRDGSLIDTAPIDVGFPVAAIASDGERFAFLHFAYRELALRFFDRDGHFQDGPPARSDADAYPATLGSLAWDGERYVAVWSREAYIGSWLGYELVAMWFDRGGRSMGPAIPISSPAYDPFGQSSVACTSGSCVVAWTSTGLQEIQRALLTGDRITALDPVVGCCTLQAPRVVASTNRFFLSWITPDNNLWGMPLSVDGSRVSQPAMIVRAPLSAEAALAAGGTVMVAYSAGVELLGHGDVARVFVRSSSSSERRRRAVPH